MRDEMSIKPDHWIRRLAIQERMIDPFEPTQVRGPMISYGLSSYGYDIRLADEALAEYRRDGGVSAAEFFRRLAAEAEATYGDSETGPAE